MSLVLAVKWCTTRKSTKKGGGGGGVGGQSSQKEGFLNGSVGKGGGGVSQGLKHKKKNS